MFSHAPPPLVFNRSSFLRAIAAAMAGGSCFKKSVWLSVREKADRDNGVCELYLNVNGTELVVTEPHSPAMQQRE
jgi:hypothetical protein